MKIEYSVDGRNLTFQGVHVSSVMAGDTILYNGILRTVCSSDIHYSSFMGISIFGDSFNTGHLPVLKWIY